MPLTLSGDGSIGPLSATEVSYLDGVTSAVQTQINGKLATPGAWSAYTPTITAESGTPTTVAATGRYCQIGKLVHCNVSIIVTTVGTATAGIVFTLPVTRADTGEPPLYAWNQTNGVGGTGASLSTNNATIRKYDWTTFWANGNVIKAFITYEAA